jgi:hypothetical protein
MKNQINHEEWANYLIGVLKGLDDRADTLPDELPADARSLPPLIDDVRDSVGILLGYFISPQHKVQTGTKGQD